MKRQFTQTILKKNYDVKFLKEINEIKNIYKFPKCEFLHIGSTYFKNSIGEEIIDILITVDNLHKITNFDEKRLNNIKYHRTGHNTKGLVSYCKITNFLYMNYNFKLYIVQKNSILYKNFIDFHNLLKNNKDSFKKYQEFKKNNFKHKNNKKLYEKKQIQFIIKILNEAKFND